VVHGDGLQSRDFTFISDVVAANLAAACAPGESCAGRVYNIAGGEASSLLDVLAALGELLGVEPRPSFVDPRPGDVRHSRADPSAAARDLGFRAEVGLVDGLRETVDWIKGLG
jgi:UDP-glucose 4-epimerase